MCGVFGIFGHPEAARLASIGLHALQHRGQESAGIASSPGGEVFLQRAMGHVAQIFDEATLANLPGIMAIGQVLAVGGLLLLGRGGGGFWLLPTPGGGPARSRLLSEGFHNSVRKE